MSFSIGSELVSQFTQAWTPKTMPTSTSLSYVDPTLIPSLMEQLAAITSSAFHATATADVLELQRSFRACEASLTIASGQGFIATAHILDPRRQYATQAVFNATLNLVNLENNDNFYGTRLTLGGNVLFTVLFALLFVYHTAMMIWSKHVYFGVCMFCGVGLEFAGYLARSLAANDLLNEDDFLCQIICLTIAPAFIMGGIYYLLAQMLIVYGRKYALLKPMWFSYIFIFCDVASLVIQAAGGGIAATALADFKSTDAGTHVMVAGIAWQVFSMSVFLILLLDWMYRIFFRSSPEIKFSFGNFFHLLFNTKKGRAIKQAQEPYFNPKYHEVRSRKVFGWSPLIILVSVLFIYVRCIYRVIELAEGWSGFLITHEAYILTLDASMVFLGCLVYFPFHPVVLFGRRDDLTLSTIKKRYDEHKHAHDDPQGGLKSDSEFFFQNTHFDSLESTKTPSY
ncbi:hypothetical protein DIURU_003027 [Diutina rugosa]|uniref:Sphingoid long-chain base transporter RSB1 n=1 Tax=Diutina rugosa TaxID=5481 RepID=A0A642UUA2_DIURU|nr:uncharacterized protein DIURU_003027 [Diutina rugosa]KAA8901976.1 hypothetical protein DIURU_003027 [Diutina rugosa]